MTRTAVYRFWDAADRLLYVGMSKRPGFRRREHKKNASWFGEIMREEIRWYPDHESAAAAEQAAIAAERPLHNKMQPPWNAPPERQPGSGGIARWAQKWDETRSR